MLILKYLHPSVLSNASIMRHFLHGRNRNYQSDLMYKSPKTTSALQSHWMYVNVTIMKTRAISTTMSTADVTMFLSCLWNGPKCSQATGRRTMIFSPELYQNLIKAVYNCEQCVTTCLQKVDILLSIELLNFLPRQVLQTKRLLPRDVNW